MIVPPFNHHLFSWQRMVVVLTLGLVVLAGCSGCGGNGSGGGVSPNGGASLVPPPAAVTRVVELKAIGSHLPVLEPYLGNEYTLLIPQNWKANYTGESGDLLIKPTSNSELQYADDPELSPGIAFSRFERYESYDTSSHAKRMETSFAESNGLTLQPLGQLTLARGGILRVSQYSELGIDSRRVVMAVPDPNDKRYAVGLAFKATTADFEAMGGTDLLAIMAGTMRRAEELPAVEVAHLQNEPIPALEGTGLTEEIITLELQTLEYAAGRGLTELEKASFAAATVRMAIQNGAEWTVNNYAILTPFFKTIQERATKAQGSDYAPFLRWLIKDYLLDSFYRSSPLQHGSPLMIQLLSESHQAAAVKGQPPKYDLSLVGLESLSAPQAVAVQGINLAKLYRAPLIQNTWQRVVNNDPSEYTQRLLSGYRQQFNLPLGQVAQAVVKSFMPQGDDLLSVLGSGQDPNTIIAPFKARNVDLHATAEDTSLYLGTTAAGKTAGVRFLTWGHIAGNEGQLRSLPNTMVDGSDAQVHEDLPLIHVRGQEAWPILLAGAQLNWLPRLTSADEQLAALMDYIDFELDVDDTLRFSVTIDFANVTVAQAAHAYYETIYSFQATAQRVAERFSLWEHLTWQRQGRRLQARVSLSPQQSQAYAAQYERDTDARILQFMYDEFERQFFENFFASIFYWNFFNSLDMSAGFISKGNNAWSGTGYSGIFYGVPF